MNDWEHLSVTEINNIINKLSTKKEIFEFCNKYNFHIKNSNISKMKNDLKRQIIYTGIFIRISKSNNFSK